MQIREIRRRDEKKARQYAADGMHFEWYISSRLVMSLYTRYFWYLETGRATQRIAAYKGDRFVGVLLAQMQGEKLPGSGWWRKCYVRIFEFLQRRLYPDGVGPYEEANRQLFHRYAATNRPEGEIIFLAADPALRNHGIGTFLLEELKRREPGREVFLYTDNACAYQFYEHRGFRRCGEKEILLNLGGRKQPLTCLLYSGNL